jgi:tRNA(fMet)-specific endonuclease VapC
MICVLDTTAFSAAMRFEPGMMSFLKNHRPGEVVTVPPVMAEIEYGIRRLDPESRKTGLLTERKTTLLKHLRVLDWTADASEHFGRMKALLEKSGTPVDDFDIAIAAVALTYGAEVITANLVHFSRIKGLVSRHWTE